MVDGFGNLVVSVEREGEHVARSMPANVHPICLYMCEGLRVPTTQGNAVKQGCLDVRDRRHSDATKIPANQRAGGRIRGRIQQRDDFSEVGTTKFDAGGYRLAA